MNIICSKNRGYKWTCERGIYFRGYFQVEEGEVYRGHDAIDRLSKIIIYDDFLVFLKEIYGSFSIIIEHGDEVWAAVDIARSMPLYYSSNLKCISDKVDCLLEFNGIDNNSLDWSSVLEMYATSYISSDRTIYEFIKQIDIGCSICVKNGSIRNDVYYRHTARITNPQRERAIALLQVTTNKALQRINKIIGDRTIVISLSGGYDSRYLACSLKENGFENVICYTYGRKDSFEPKQSKLVANALGYEWHCVYYDDMPCDLLVSDEIQEYYNYSRNYDYISYIQNYYAFKNLVKNDVIPENAVVLTGLCNDMPSGFYTPSEDVAKRYGYTTKGCADYLYDTLFIKFELTSHAKESFINKIENDLEKRSLEVFDYESFIKATDCVNTGYSHSRCFLHMNDVHEFFGHEWIVPCWDKDLLNFWYSLPAKHRIHQNLYETYITDYIGKKYGVDTKKTIRSVAKKQILRKIIRRVGSLVVKPALWIGIPVRRKTDINNFAPQEVSIYREINNKKAIKSKYAALTLMLTVYFLDKRHGPGWYNQIKELIVK